MEVTTSWTPPMSFASRDWPHLTRPRAREEREREPLQVLVDGGAQVVHHALPDLVREQRLHDAERPGDDRDRDHPRDEQVQQLEIPFGEGDVEDLLDQERRIEPSSDEKRIRPRTPASRSR